jgi:predicted dehydrogenase
MEAMRALPSDYDVVGIAEANDSSRAQAAKNKAYGELTWLDETTLLADKTIALVAIETTLEDSTATAERAIAAGKHIHLDKPGGAKHAAFARMRKQAETQGLHVQMGYMLRHQPAFTLLFQAAREGWFGDILEINATMGKQADPGLRKTLSAIPGHGMFELGCHLVDAVVTLLGAPNKVTAFAAATKAPGDPLLDNQLAVLEYPKALVTLRSHHNDPGGFGRRAFSVIGTKGSMELFPLESGKGSITLAEKHLDFHSGRNEFALPQPRGRYDSEFQALARWIRGQETSPWTAEHDIVVHRTALLAAGCEIDE